MTGTVIVAVKVIGIVIVTVIVTMIGYSEDTYRACDSDNGIKSERNTDTDSDRDLDSHGNSDSKCYSDSYTNRGK